MYAENLVLNIVNLDLDLGPFPLDCFNLVRCEEMDVDKSGGNIKQNSCPNGTMIFNKCLCYFPFKALVSSFASFLTILE